MLFCAGPGASLLVWSGVEWAYYIDAPPLGAEPRSAQAFALAAAYGPFHWGITAWALYALPTIAIAYPFYVKRVPHLRPSTSLHAILGSHGKDSIVGRLVDLAAMIALLGGAGTSLGVIALWGLATHAILKLSGGAPHSIGRTYQALCYSVGANITTAVPCVGLYPFIFIGLSWWLVSAVLMLAAGQRVHGGRATLAALTFPALLVTVLTAGGLLALTSATTTFRGGMGAPQAVAATALTIRTSPLWPCSSMQRWARSRSV